MYKSCTTSYCQRLKEFEFFVVVFEEKFQVFIGKEVAGMRWYAPKRHHMRTFPESKQAFLGIQCLKNTFNRQISATCLYMSLNEIISV